ncbi:aconitate hydratase [Kibdelosporangium lantanae]
MELFDVTAPASKDSFGARGTLTVGDTSYEVFRLSAVEGAERLPYSLKILLENLLRTEDGANITADHVRALAGWDPTAEPATEIQFTPARVVMQDFTGVPCIVDLATMREAVTQLGGDADKVNPLAPAELVIDHSVIADIFGRPDAFEKNVDLEYERNKERYQFLRWGQTAFDEFKVVPPGTGIVHQVNIEHLARVVMVRNGQAYPDTLVGTDSHTTMVNGIGVLGWGVGGIEAEAAMLGQPVSMLIPRVVGFKLHGELPAGATATDLVLTITEMLRKHGVVGKFVEFYGSGVSAVPLANRATIGNMSPEFGSTCAIFPIDAETVDYLKLTGRSAEQLALVEAYAKEQGMWHDPAVEPAYSETLELDLSTVVPSIAGPKRPQDRIELANSKPAFRSALVNYVAHTEEQNSAVDEAVEETFPASDPISVHEGENGGGKPRVQSAAEGSEGRPSAPTTVTVDGNTFELDHGAVAIAAITSCTNTSNPSVMIGAALLAKKAVERGLERKPWVKTTLAPGSKVVMDYYERAGLLPYLEKLGFHLVGYGCTTCIGNSGPLQDEISQAAQDQDLALVSVLSGNRNFEGRINPDIKMNYLASPPLVVAYALAGSMDLDIVKEPSAPARTAPRCTWPTSGPRRRRSRRSSRRRSRRRCSPTTTPTCSRATSGGSRCRRRPATRSSGPRTPPTYASPRTSRAWRTSRRRSRTSPVPGCWRCWATRSPRTTSPAGAIKQDSPAGKYLTEHGVERRDFNSYGSRRGNHEVMIRGTFANIRLRNLLLDDVQGGFTRNFLEADAPQTTIYDASVAYAEAGVPLVVLAGKEYGSGSSRDWAAKGTSLLGVRAVIAESFERIHRSNLIGMGVLPLQFPDGETASSLGLDGTETFDFTGITELNSGNTPRTVKVTATRADGGKVEFDAVVRIDTPGEADYYRNGGIMQYVLRKMVRS